MNSEDGPQPLWERVDDASQPPLVIAEISGNHLGSLERAKELIWAAKSCSADVVKFQHYSPETITVQSDHPDFVIGGDSLWRGRNLWELYAEAMTPWEWTNELVDTCRGAGIPWFSSPFDETAVDFLEGFDPPMYKVASFEIIDIPLIKKIASTGRPMILSTGMATEDEISEAVEAASSFGVAHIALLRTSSAYPAPIEEMDLRAISFLSEQYGVPIGLSDHTTGNTAAIVATAFGARVFEKHLTLKRSDGGPDAAFSLEPAEFSDYVDLIRDAHRTIGSVRIGPSDKETASLRLRPSIRAKKHIGAHEELTPENVATIRPAGGLHPRHFPELLGRRSTRPLAPGDPIKWEDLED